MDDAIEVTFEEMRADYVRVQLAQRNNIRRWRANGSKPASDAAREIARLQALIEFVDEAREICPELTRTRYINL